MTRFPVRRGHAATVIATLLAVFILWHSANGQAVPAMEGPVPPHASAGFKVTFGLKQKYHGRSWAGVLSSPAQAKAVGGWHLDASDTVSPSRWDITLRTVGGDTPEKAVILDVSSPQDRPVTIYTRDGDLSFRPVEAPWGVTYYPPETNGDVSVERVPLAHTVSALDAENDDPALVHARDGTYWMAWVGYRTIGRNGYQIDGGDQVLVSHSRDGSTWSPPAAVTQPGDHFRVALAEDARGRIWCVYGLQKKMETGNFDLYAKVFDGRAWGGEQQLTSDTRPDIFHRLASDQRGNLYLVWMGFRPQSEILLKVWNGARWSEEIPVSPASEDNWEPAIATDSAGRAWIAWDSYRATSYDLLLRSYFNGALEPLRTVSATPYAEMHADVAVDSGDRVWIAWEEGGVNWGKDTGYENPKQRIHLRPGGSKIYGPVNSRAYAYRRPRVAVLEGGKLGQPVDLAVAFPQSLQANLFQNPRLGLDAMGRVWVFLRHQFSAKGRYAGHLFDFYATTLSGEGAQQTWIDPVLLPSSTGRQDTVLATAPGVGRGIVAAVAGDGRQLPVPLPIHNDVAAMTLDAQVLGPAPPVLHPFVPSPAPPVEATHPREQKQVEQVRSHRLEAGGARYKILRGDLHRHTEISMDGAIDGTLWDFYRYALDAAAFDYAGLTDHNYGAWLDTDEPDSPNTDNVYQWWRTQKSADMFYVPGRFVPLYGYERSINFPLGHRNIFHVRRGIFSLRVPKLYIAERAELIDKDARDLRNYLRSTGGVGLPHTSATSMGTDWRLRDDALEPVTEIYQGDRNSYEAEGQPRAALGTAWGPGSAGRPPYQRGLIWVALGAGYRMGFIASSDHDSTHISYANLLVPEGVTNREDIQQALRMRRTYASTDNIVMDFHAGATIQGGELTSVASPAFEVSIIGTEAILRVEVIKNGKVVYTKQPEQDAADPAKLQFTFQDGAFAETETSWYYVRVLQSFSEEQPKVEGEVAWSSPIYVRRPK